MEVEVRVMRARVWMCSSLFLRQDGFLSLTKIGEAEHVAHATLRSLEKKNGDRDSIEEATEQHNKHHHFRTVLMAWDEQGATPGNNCPRFSLPASPRVTKSDHRTALPRLDFQLFALKPRSRNGTSARSRPRTVYIGASGWQLTENDVEALVSSREVVYLTTLQDELGTLEVKLRCVNSSKLDSALDETRVQAEEESEAPAGFSINWSSSEALQKDLAEKARLKVLADKKLIAQLKHSASTAAQLQEAREFLIVHCHRSQAATKIQRRYRERLNRKRENMTKLQQEEEARIAAKKARVREKVIARNHQRALAMRARLLRINNNCSYTMKEPDLERLAPRKMVVDLMNTERVRLTEKLASLEVQRRQFSRGKCREGNNQHSSQENRDYLFDDELIRAVQELHFSRAHANNQTLQHWPS